MENSWGTVLFEFLSLMVLKKKIVNYYETNLVIYRALRILNLELTLLCNKDYKFPVFWELIHNK